MLSLLKLLKDLPEMLRRVPTCVKISNSEGHGGIGFSDGSVSMWTASSLRSLLEAAEEAERVGRLACEDREEVERDEDDPEINNQDSSQSVEDRPLAVEKIKGVGADEECIDALTFVMRWDEITGVKMLVVALSAGRVHSPVRLESPRDLIKLLNNQPLVFFRK